MGIIHADPVPQFADNPWLRSPGQYASDHVGVSCQQLGEIILDAPATDITFANIPQTYRSLCIDIMGAGDIAATTIGLDVQFNGDTAANYEYGQIKNIGSSAVGGEQRAQTAILVGTLAAATATANDTGCHKIWVPGYAMTVWNKITLSQGVLRWAANTNTLTTGVVGGVWRSTAAITDIKLFPLSGNFVAGSFATLWGFV